MDLIKKNLDVIFLIAALILYVFQVSFFPVLLLAFIFLWYRRELIWRIETQNAGFKRNPFRLDKQFDFPVYVLFFILGWFWIVFCLFFWVVLDNDIIANFLIRDVFSHGLEYLYPAHIASEESIANSYIVYSREFHKQEISRSDSLYVNYMYRLELSLLTSYILIFGRYFFMQPFYALSMASNRIRFNWYKLVPIVLVFALLYWLFFLNPVHRDVCPTSRAGILCTDLGKFKYFSFPTRILLYWTIILSFLNLAFRDALTTGDKK